MNTIQILESLFSSRSVVLVQTSRLFECAFEKAFYFYFLVMNCCLSLRQLSYYRQRKLIVQTAHVPCDARQGKERGKKAKTKNNVERRTFH